MTYYPVGIPTLYRYEHFKRCVESLARNTHADKTELVIGLDYPPSEKYRDGYEKISEYVDTIEGFAKVTIFRHKKNLGAIKNWEYVQNYIFENYDAAIMTEDDNEFSACVIDYINKGLMKYKETDCVTAICGYNYPVDMSECNSDTFLYHQYSAWGVGLWKHKIPDLSYTYAIKILKNPLLAYELYKNKSSIFYQLVSMVYKNECWGDLLWVVNNVVNKKYCLFPKLSLSKNLGHDGSGVHCEAMNPDNIYNKQEINQCDNFVLDNIELKPIISKSLETYFSLPLRSIIGSLIRLPFVLLKILK